jgi:solute carrier family 25 thiamine pyrophosphate transporter 19
MALQTSDDHAPPMRRLNPTGQMLAGFAAGFTARCAIAPLDVLKIRLQLQAGMLSEAATGARTPPYKGLTEAFLRIAREEGVRAFWRGNGAAFLLWGAYVGIQFPVYTAARKNVGGLDERSSALVAGATSGAVATLLTYPLDWARTRRAAGPSGSIVPPATRSINWRAPFSGLSAALAAVVPSAAITFALYEGAAEVWDASAPSFRAVGYTLVADSSSVNAIVDAARASICGGIAGVGAKALTYPLDTAKKRMQVAGLDDLSWPPLRGPIDALRRIAAVEGLAGWYRGALPALLKSAFSTAIIFGTYDMFRALCIKSPMLVA